jgi:hypothetical protein
MLLLADRGAFSYPAFSAAVETGAQLLWRVKSDTDLSMLGEVPYGSYQSEVRPGIRHDKVGPGARFPAHVIEYTVTTPGKEASVFRLVTTLLDPAGGTAAELARAYAGRWEIEGCLDEPRTHERGAGLVLRSKTPSGVIQEIYGYLCVHYALRSLVGEAPEEFDEDPLRFSFICTLRAARRSLAGQPAFPPELLTAALVVLCPEVMSELLPPRRDRSLPRQVKRKMTRWLVKKVPKTGSK